MKNLSFLSDLMLPFMTILVFSTLPTKTSIGQDKVVPIHKSEEEWKKILTKEQYEVMRNEATERPFTGHLLYNKKKGIYKCSACALPLFHSKTKFNSGTGWPSFFDRVSPSHVTTKEDHSLGMKRTEVHCGRCGGHLGHVFDDGPQPTGLRYCINSVSLDFEEQKNP
jgi:peptide-methionine (R)-S-oxide reductase